MKNNHRKDRLYAFEAWNTVPDTYIADAALPDRQVSPSARPRPVLHALNRFFHSGAWAAAISAVVSLSVLAAIVWAGRATPPVTDSVGANPSLDQITESTTEGVEQKEEQTSTTTLTVTDKIYTYQGNQVAILNVQNSTDNHRTVTVVGRYLDEEGQEILSETRVLEVLPAGGENHVVFNPGMTFADFAYKVTDESYIGQTVLDKMYNMEFAGVHLRFARARYENGEVIPLDGDFITVDAMFAHTDNYGINRTMTVDYVVFDDNGEIYTIETRTGGSAGGTSSYAGITLQYTDTELDIDRWSREEWITWTTWANDDKYPWPAELTREQAEGMTGIAAIREVKVAIPHNWTESPEDDTPLTGEFSHEAKTYTYGENNVAIVYAENLSPETYTVTVTGRYLDAEGQIIGTETKRFEGFTAGWKNQFIFNPGYAFAEFDYEVQTELYEGESVPRSYQVRFNSVTFLPTRCKDVDGESVFLGGDYVQVVAMFDYVNTLYNADVEYVLFDENGDIILIEKGSVQSHASGKHFPLYVTDMPVDVTLWSDDDWLHWLTGQARDTHEWPEEFPKEKADAMTGIAAIVDVKF